MNSASTKVLSVPQQDFCKGYLTKRFVNPGVMEIPTDAASASRWMRTERDARGWSTNTLADRARAIARREGSAIKLTQQSISNFEQPGAKRLPEWLRFVRAAFEAPSDGGKDQLRVVEPDIPPVRDAHAADDAVEIQLLDLSFSMGPGATIDDYIEETPVKMDMGLLRNITRTPFPRLRLARGVGESMWPTLSSGDLVLIDTVQNQLTMQDRIWAISLFGAAAIKRLRTISRDRVLVISDNQAVDNQEVDAADLIIHGRVIWFSRMI
jgi:hypothetical protein